MTRWMIDFDSANRYCHTFYSHHIEYYEWLSCSMIIWKTNPTYWRYRVQLFYLHLCIIFDWQSRSSIISKRNHWDPVILFLDFDRLRTIQYWLLRNEDHISSEWSVPMYREGLVHLSYGHEANDSKAVYLLRITDEMNNHDFQSILLFYFVSNNLHISIG